MSHVLYGQNYKYFVVLSGDCTYKEVNI